MNCTEHLAHFSFINNIPLFALTRLEGTSENDQKTRATENESNDEDRERRKMVSSRVISIMHGKIYEKCNKLTHVGRL